MRLAFLGSPAPAAVALEALVDAGHDIALVVTRPDKRRGRGAAAGPTPVKAAAARLGLPCTHDPADVERVGAELGVVVAYGRLIKPEVLRALKMVNIHFSLLPRWRGAAPVERAILAGDTVTGICLMEIDEGLDTGAVYGRVEVTIGAEETAEELTGRLAVTGARFLVQSLADGLGEPVAQHGEPTYAAKLEPAELHLEWSRPAEELHRVVRLGRAWTTWRGHRLLVLRAQVIAGEGHGGALGSLEEDRVETGRGMLRLVTVQPEGRRPLPASEWLRGARPGPGDRLGA